MKRKFIIFDRDGVINIEKSYLYKIEDFEYEKGIIEGLTELKKLGYSFIIITNQAGIARGYYTEEEYLKLEKFIKYSVDYGKYKLTIDYNNMTKNELEKAVVIMESLKLALISIEDNYKEYINVEFEEVR